MVDPHRTAQLHSQVQRVGSRCAFLIRIGRSHRPREPEPLVIELTRLKELRWGRRAGAADELLEEAAGVSALALADPSLSTEHARIARSGRSVFVLEDLKSTNGCRLNGMRLDQPAALSHGDVIETGQTFWCFHFAPVLVLDELLPRLYDGGPITPSSTVNFAMAEALLQLQRVAESNLAVILCGESGTGKEVVASELHRMSGRQGPYVALNCAAIPEGLIESELFGHRRGAFTGAVADKKGMIEAAEGGTLLLDEVGDMPLSAQAKLLRALQEGVVVRVGETRAREVDVRFASATHRDLRQMVDDGDFRGDLYARLNGLSIRLPPLRERKEDLGILLATFLRRHGSSELSVAHDTFRALTLHAWPFNIRELDKAVAVAVALGEASGELMPAHLPAEVRDGAAAAVAPTGGQSGTPAPQASAPTPTARRRRERPSEEDLQQTLVRTLREQAGNISAVAREMDTTRMQIHRWMKRFAIDPESFRE